MKTYSSLKEVQTDLFNNTISCVGLTQAYLKRIDEQKHLNAFLEVFEKSALEKAKIVDEKIKTICKANLQEW